MAIWDWSKVAASNTSPESVSIAEGMSPAGVNNSLRALVAALAEFRDDTGGQLSTASSTTAYTVTTNGGLAAYANGVRIAAKIHATSTDSVTLNIDTLGAKKVYVATGTALAQATTGDLVISHIGDFAYNSALDGGNGGFHLLSLLKYPDASDTAKGIVELATQAEVNTGSDTGRAIAPSTLAGRPKFRATKGGTNQTGVAAATLTLVTWSTEDWDVGGYFASNKWTPPAGKYVLNAQITNDGSVDGNEFTVSLYKNGSLVFASPTVPGSTAAQCSQITTTVDANGTDYFEVYVYGAGGTYTIRGVTTSTWFEGWAI